MKGPNPPELTLYPWDVLNRTGSQRLARFLQEMNGRPVVRLKAPIQVYLTNDPEIARHVLQENHLNYRKAPTYGVLRPLVGEGLLISEGDFWKRQRRLAQPAFHREQLARMTALMADAIGRLLQRWDAVARGDGRLNVGAEVTRLTLSITGEALFGVDLANEAAELGAATTAAGEELNHRLLSPLKLPLALPTPRNRRLRKAIAIIDQRVGGLIAERRRAAEPGLDLLGMFLSVRDADTGEGMNDVQLRDEVTTMVLAGHETTASTLAWAFYLLSVYPDAQARLRAEVEQVLGERAPTFEDLPRLAFTGRVVSEALRLYPPAWIIQRESKAPDVIGGYPIPAGASIAVSPYFLHHNAEHWENPEGFDPDRFLPERAKGRHRFAYLPFAAGPRQCIGNSFALMEAQLALALILRRYHVHLEPGHPVEPELLITLRPRGGQVRCQIQRVKSPSLAGAA